MDLVEYFKIKKRVCKSAGYRCDKCFMANCAEECCNLELNHPGEAVSAMEQWAAEHPPKTILQDFLEKYPDAPMKPYGIPMDICPSDLGCSRHELCTYESEICTKCWNRPLEETKNESLD